MTKYTADRLQEKLSSIDIELYSEDILEIEDIDELEEYLQDNRLLDVEVIYYSKAMDYLRENDPSLQLSLGLAHDMGYTAEHINSELLASLLASQNLQEEFSDIRDELEEIIESSKCPECGEWLEPKMVDIDGLNLVEMLTCSGCEYKKSIEEA